MKKFIPIIKKQCDESDLDIYWYAALMDRTLVLEGKDQIYGTQYFTDVLGETKLVNIKSIESVNEARRAIGLKPLTN